MSVTGMSKMIAVVLLNVIVTVSFYLLKRRTKFGNIPRIRQQLLAGVAFGLCAVIATEYGVDIGGAVINVRDAAPLTAGLLFGGPAGITAGLIGGIERWFAAYWGAGMYSQLACSVSTILAGFYAAFLRKVLLDSKRPSWLFAFITGAIMEIIHLTILFLTHLDDPQKAYGIVKLCTGPMVLCNATAVMLSTIFIKIASSGVHRGEKRYTRISQQVQTPLLIVVIAAFLVTSSFVYQLQTGTADEESKKLLRINIEDISKDILEESNENILKITHNVASDIEENPDADLNKLAEKYNVSDIYVIDEKGIVVRSLNPEYVGFDMNSDADKPEEERQSSLFMVLLRDDTDEYVQETKALAANSDVLRKLAGVSLKTGGFVQVGLDPETFGKEIESQIRILTKNRHIRETGYIITSDIDRNIISADSSLDGKKLEDIGVKISYKTNYLTKFEGKINGEDSFYMIDEAEGFNIIAVMPTAEIYSERDENVYVNSYMEILIFSALFLVIYIIIKRTVVNRIHSVNESLGKIIDGNLDTKVDVRSSDEFVSLSDDINSTVATLKHYIEEAAGRIDKELAFAKQIQHSALPNVFPAYPNRHEFDIYASMDTAKEVGGDFYDFYFTDRTKLGFLIADVSGKGIPAAMFMMRAKTAIKNLAETGLPVNEVFTKANAELCEGNDAEMFVTAWMGIIDITTGHVEFACAGHNAPLLYRKGQGFEYITQKPGFILAGMEGMQYKLQEFDLNPGDRIVLYTDGVTEATTADKQLYGENRLRDFLNDNSTLTLDETLKAVRADIDNFVGGAEQFDDITMLILEYKGEEIKLNEKVFNADVSELEPAQEFLESEMESAGVDIKTARRIQIAFEEMFVNVAHYAYPEGGGDVTVGVSAANGEIVIRLTDSGIEFDPLKKEDPDTTLSADEMQIGGLGIFMVKKTMDELTYVRKDNKNIFTMRKKYE